MKQAKDIVFENFPDMYNDIARKHMYDAIIKMVAKTQSESLNYAVDKVKETILQLDDQTRVSYLDRVAMGMDEVRHEAKHILKTVGVTPDDEQYVLD